MVFCLKYGLEIGVVIRYAYSVDGDNLEGQKNDREFIQQDFNKFNTFLVAANPGQLNQIKYSAVIIGLFLIHALFPTVIFFRQHTAHVSHILSILKFFNINQIHEHTISVPSCERPKLSGQAQQRLPLAGNQRSDSQCVKHAVSG